MGCKYKYLLAALCFFVSGCIRENADQCRSIVTLRYVYELHNHGGDRFADEVKHLHIYIYDQIGAFVCEMDYPSGSMDVPGIISFPLETGRYTAVSWGNIHTENYSARAAAALSEYTLSAACIDGIGRFATAEPGTLFHGIAKFEVPAGGDVDKTVPLTKNTSYIYLNLDGITEESGVTAAGEICSNNTVYLHDNTISRMAPGVTYIPAIGRDGEHSYQKFQVLRLMATDRTSVLRITVTDPNLPDGVFIHEEPLVPLLLTKAGGDVQEFLDRADEHKIYVKFAADGTVEFSTVQSWEDIEDEKGLGW